MDGLSQKEMFVQKVGTSGPLVRSPTNGRASRASLPKSANSEPVTIRQYGRDGRAPWKNRAQPRFSCVSDGMNTAQVSSEEDPSCGLQRTTRPETLPPINASTSARDEKLKSPSIEWARHEAAVAKRMAVCGAASSGVFSA